MWQQGLNTRGEHRLPYLKNETQYRILIKQGGTDKSEDI